MTQSTSVPKVRLDILVDDGDVDRVVQAILDSARTGKIGDGKIWVQAVEETWRICTGRAALDALLTLVRRLRVLVLGVDCAYERSAVPGERLASCRLTPASGACRTAD